MNRRWIAQRLGISAFLAMHLAALAIYNMPACALRARLFPYASTYLIPLGLWQNWGMFAPNPAACEMTVEAITLDAKGIQRTFAFPKMADFSILRAAPRVRHSKYASNIGDDENVAIRECAARHVIRQLHIPEDAYPVEVELYYQVRETPKLGEGPLDPMKPTVPHTLKSYRFASAEDIRS
ncbi:hypothetical protein TA3x_002369 [Tundrisphaera sp. TA3]|uniref:hypothetical protein n=1 Tax=Tundrisphaera sp. TA3 TaxID=3435775 RepID=UPI003EC0AE35